MGKRALALFVLPFLLFYALPVQAAEKEERLWQDEAIYFLMVDRFNNMDPTNDKDVNVNDPRAYHGGDLKGVIDKLDYIKDMGLTAIWLTPIFQNEPGGYHGYWISDFYKVDKHFGTLSDLKTLVKEAHKRDMKVILDLVVNHTGYHHPWLNDPKKKDWFHEKNDIFNWDDQQQVENGWVFGLPDLAQENPQVKRYLINMAKWWIKETDIDGYRLDTVKHVPKSFWQEFAKEVKSVKKDFFLLGEVWNDDPRYIADYGKYGIDGFVDYPLYNEITKVFSKRDQSLRPLYDVWEYDKTFYDRPYLLGTFLDNHDTVRFTRLAIENKQNPITRIKLGLTYLFSAPGIPIMYYGTEIAMDGGNDPDNRRLMNFRTDKEIIDYIKKLGELRQQLPSLRRGDFTLLYEKNGMAVFKRTYKDETAVIAINNTGKTRKVHLTNNQLAPGKELRGLLAGDLVRSDRDGYDLILNRETAEIYVLAKKTGLNIPFIATLIAIYVLFGLFLYYVKKRSKQTT
ncbi:alpha-amylase family glycosyl hydrolase [Thermaerobacillus caldiproteolyticus]|uniref:alpha-amylase family glycosyl hydrolase n=1 Tax=Thermaerobacillus caldiproteolyticus TaxID=247480 RepID=UPI0018F167EE|nr:alpha-amylase family glycosyl hydrolase [Anoxybacillus caldiproteolyticus]